MEAADSNIGRVLDGKYRIDALLGTGGMGIVYRATDLRLGRVVAVKLIRADVRDRHAVVRFEREAQAVARLRHPNIVTIHDVGIEQGSGAYMVMELLEGRSLRAELDSRGRLPAAEAVEFGRQACRALQAAHDAGVVHRDVKPANVFLDREGVTVTVKMVDFGLARLEAVASLSNPAVVQGTPRYMSPEQFDPQQEEDSRSDLYSLGIVLYEALAGRPPFEAKTALGYMTRHAFEPPPPLGGDVASGLAAAVLRALEKRPESRYPTADDFGRALEAVMDDVGQAAQELVFGEFRLRVDADVLSRNGHAVGLERQAVRVLRYLIANRGRVVSKRELFEKLWPDVFTTDSVLTRLVSLVRRTLGDGAKDARYIRTFYGQGYQFIATVAVDDTDGGKGSKADTDPRAVVVQTHPGPLTNLPYPVTSFVGRERELERVGETIGRARLVTLTGPGGVGKTRLAIEAARRTLANHFDGVWLVELASLSDPALVPGAVAAALGVRERPDRPLLDTLAAWLADKYLLLVLDNCEHLVDACAALVERLLPAAAGLRVLATSREVLDVYGESVWPVPALGSAAPGDDAVRLFVERARAARSDFAPAPGDEAAIARLCAELEGIPLSIELAAARVRAFPVDEILARMSDRFSLLARARDRGGRHRALRATLDWSHDLLSPEERTLLARLSVFAGGWTRESAEAVAGVSTQGSLDRLVDKSLVTVGPETERYGMLETIREYAREKLRESGDEAATLSRHAAWCLETAERLQYTLITGEEGPTGRSDAEYDNMRAALRWSIDEGNDPETGLRLCLPLNLFWIMRGYLREGRAWTDAALAAAPAAPVSVRCRAISGAGVLAEAQGDLGRARALVEAAFGELRGEDNPMVAARLHWRLGIVLERTGEYDAAEAQWAAGLVIAERLDEPEVLAGLLNSLGIIAQDREDFGLAREHWERTLDLWRGVGNAPNIAVTLYNLGELAAYEQNFDEAARLAGEALEMGRAHGLTAVVAAAANVLGNVAVVTGRYEAARARYVESLELARETGDREQLVRTLDGFARLAAAEGDAVRAIRLAGAAEALCRAIEFRLHPPHRRAFERAIEPARLALTLSEAARELDAGAAMSVDEAIAYALDGGRS